MRTVLVLAVVLMSSGALADDVGDARRLALQGRDSYWNCLARAYSLPAARALSAGDFTAEIASICPSERQNFRVTLLDYLSMQYPDRDAGSHLSTANRAIDRAQQDIITAFVRHKAN